jgi:hypothetical protein
MHYFTFHIPFPIIHITLYTTLLTSEAVTKSYTAALQRRWQYLRVYTTPFAVEQKVEMKTNQGAEGIGEEI